jgi:hypothetical protein
MPKHRMQTAMIIVGVAGILAAAVWAQSPVPSSPAQQKTAIKKKARKSAPAKVDSVPAAVTLPPQDSGMPGKDLKTPALFSFRVVTEPESASVLLDDSAKGFSPCTLSFVAPGNHVLTIRKSGYYLKKAEIAVDSASPPELSFVLLKPAFLRVTSNPPGAALLIDGTKEGATPYESDKVKPGEHSLKVEIKQYAAAERFLTVKNGGRDTVNFALEHTKAYNDSVETAQRAAEKLQKDRFTFTVVSAIFCLCALLLVVIEANNQ